MLGKRVFDAFSEQNFGEFAIECAGIGEEVVFRQLHGNRRATRANAAAGDELAKGAA